MTQETTTYACRGCEASRSGKRLPRGWHRIPPDGSGLYCPRCWQARYLLRAITIPVAGPVDGTWEELREALRACWQATTRLSNWAVRELAKHDVVRTPAMSKLPPQPPVYLYPGAREVCPELDTGSVVAILHAVEGRYRSRRFETIWLGRASLPNYRYPTPYPIRAQDWHAEEGKDKVPLVSVRLGGRRWLLRLRGSGEFRRQLAAFAQIVRGEAAAAELALYERRTGQAGHRPGIAGRDAGGQKTTARLMAKLVAWFPRPPAREGSGTLYVRTDSDALLIALDVKDERLWVHNADQVRRWTAEHARRVQRWSDDQKAEQRPQARFASRRQAAVLKYRNRLDSACHEAAAQLIGFARRRRFAAIRYDDAVQSYCTRFPWEKLRRLVAEKADAAEIRFERPGDAETPATARVDATKGVS